MVEIYLKTRLILYPVKYSTYHISLLVGLHLPTDPKATAPSWLAAPSSSPTRPLPKARACRLQTLQYVPPCRFTSAPRFKSNYTILALRPKAAVFNVFPYSSPRVFTFAPLSLAAVLLPLASKAYRGAGTGASSIPPVEQSPISLHVYVCALHNAVVNSLA